MQDEDSTGTDSVAVDESKLLKADNYPSWSVFVVDKLLKARVADFCTKKGYMRSIDKMVVEGVITGERSWFLKQGDQTARVTLRYNCSDAYKLMIQNASTGRKALRILEKNFQETDPGVQGDLISEFCTLNLESCKDIDEYIAQHENSS